MKVDTRLRAVLIVVLFGFGLAFVIALANGQSLLVSVYGSLVLTIVAAVLAMLLIWAVEIAEEKGYGMWFALLAVLFLNALGLLLLLALPRRKDREEPEAGHGV